MTYRRMRWLLWLASLLLLACTIGVGYWAHNEPLAIDQPELTIQATKVATTVESHKAGDQPKLSKDEKSKLLKRPLRVALIDPPPPKVELAPPPATRPKPPLAAKLVGTILESGQQTALIQTGPTEIEVRRTGETLGGNSRGARIKSIGAKSVQVEYQGENLELILETESTPVKEGAQP